MALRFLLTARTHCSQLLQTCARPRQLVAIAALTLCWPLYAQQSDATLRGKIAPATVASGGQALAQDVNGGYRRSAEIREDGAYTFASLRPGRYRLEITAPSGATTSAEVVLRVGENAVVNLDLPSQSGTDVAQLEEVVVTGQVIKLQQGAEVGLNITPELIDALPQNSRNFLAFADLAPGVTFQRGSNGATSIQGGAQASNSVNVFIDGVGQKDYVLKSGITGQDSSPGNPFPQSAIGEYRVITQNYKAEFDQVSSAAITAVTRSGGNEFHGDVFWDFTNESFRSETPSEEDQGGDKTETEDNQFGVSVGGPIIANKLHFFTAYEGKRNQLPVQVSPGAGFTAADLPTEYASQLGNFNREFDEDLIFAKLDWFPSDFDLVQFSVKLREETGLRWDNGANAPSFTHDINNDETRVLLRYERSAERWINDLRLTYEDSAFNPQPDVEIARILQTSGRQTILNTGGHPNFQDKGQNGFGIQNDFTWTDLPNHTIKAGIKMKWVDLETVQQQPFNPQYRFNVEFDPTGAGGFNDQVPYELRFGTPLTGIGDGSAISDNFQLGLYIQDDWLVTDRLELNLGIRWDYEESPIYLDYVTPSDAVNAVTTWPNIQNTNYNISDFISNGNNRDAPDDLWQPRLGFSYDLTEDGRYTLFGGIGRSYNRNQFDFIQAESTRGTFPTVSFQFDTGDPDNPCDGCPVWDPIYLTQEGRDQLVAAAPPGGSRELRLLTNDLTVPYADQLSLGVRSYWGDWDGEIGVTRTEAKDGFAWLLGNRLEDGSFFPPGAVFGAPFGSRPPGFGSLLLGVNGLESEANTLYLKATKLYDPESGWGLNATYTYTDAEENRKFGETFSLDFPSLDDYPVLTSAGVPEHSLVVAGNVDLPWGLKLSGKMTYRSEPFIYGVGRPGDENNQRVPRVTKAADDFRQLDLALTKYFDIGGFGVDGTRLRLRLDVLNVLDTNNFAQFIGNGTRDDFGQVNNLGIGGNFPRTMKLSIGMSF